MHKCMGNNVIEDDIKKTMYKTIQKLTDLAYKYVRLFGMDETIGPIHYKDEKYSEYLDYQKSK